MEIISITAMLLIWMVLGSVLGALRAKYNHWTSQSLVHKCISLNTSGYAAHYCCVRYMWDGCVKITSKAFWGLNIAPEFFLCRHRWSIVADGHPMPFKYRYAFRKGSITDHSNFTEKSKSNQATASGGTGVSTTEGTLWQRNAIVVKVWVQVHDNACLMHK